MYLFFCIERAWPLLSHFHQDKHRPFPPPILRFSPSPLLLRCSKTLPRKEPKRSFLPAEPLVPSPVSAPGPSGVVTPYAFSPSLSPSDSAPTGPAVPGSPSSPVRISCDGNTGQAARLNTWAERASYAGGVGRARRGGAGAAGWGVCPESLTSACAGCRAWGRGLRGLGRKGRGLRCRKSCALAGAGGSLEG